MGVVSALHAFIVWIRACLPITTAQAVKISWEHIKIKKEKKITTLTFQGHDLFIDMETGVFIINIQFYKPLFGEETAKEIAIYSMEEKQLHHWFVRAPVFLQNTHETVRRLYQKHKNNLEQLRDDITHGESLERLKQITQNCQLVYATSMETAKWLLNYMPCRISGGVPSLNWIPNSKKRCPLHRLPKHTSTACAFNVLARVLKPLNLKFPEP